MSTQITSVDNKSRHERRAFCRPSAHRIDSLGRHKQANDHYAQTKVRDAYPHDQTIRQHKTFPNPTTIPYKTFPTTLSLQHFPKAPTKLSLQNFPYRADSFCVMTLKNLNKYLRIHFFSMFLWRLLDTEIMLGFQAPRLFGRSQ